MKQDLTFNISLVDYLDSLLGSTDKQAPPNDRIAEIVEALSVNKQLCYVEWPDEINLLKHPLIWRWTDWINNSQRIERQREYSRQQRVKRFIFEANVRLVATFCRSYFLMDEDFATDTAHSLMSREKWLGIKTIGCNKLITREDEL